MANARLLYKSISISVQVNKLPLPARLLFTWLIPHADDEGRLKGDPFYIKATVVPMTNWSVKKIETYLNAMSKLGLIHYWQQNSEWFVEFVKWLEYQHIRKDRFTTSSLPSYPHDNDNQQTTNGQPDDNKGAPQDNINKVKSSEANIDQSLKTANGNAKARKYTSIDDIHEEDLQYIAQKYSVSIGFVRLQFEKLQNWCEAKNKRYRDYKKALMNWVLTDMQKQIEREANDKYRGIDARHVK